MPPRDKVIQVVVPVCEFLRPTHGEVSHISFYYFCSDNKVLKTQFLSSDKKSIALPKFYITVQMIGTLEK